MTRHLYKAIWGLSAVIFAGVVGLPLNVEVQLSIALAAIVGMVLIKKARLGGSWRTIFLGLGTFVVLRYLAWRLTSTVPSLDTPADLAAGLVVLAAECYCVLMLFLSLFTVAQPVNRPRAPMLSDSDAPLVDIFVPSYNESIEIVAPTLAAAKRMRYPEHKLNVFLLDDGGTLQKLQSADPIAAERARDRRRQMQSLCVELGVHYIARDINVHAKAGNLNNALANSGGELIVVFDADHVPSREFLQETVGFFHKDEKLFLVQTPHFFLNPDPVEKNLSAVGMPAENEMFYSLAQKGLDKWNATFFCGSAAVLRRKALDEVGGFQGSSITEDAESALELHSRGWNSLYVDKPMIAGLQPETFDAFIKQRSRWCQGMVQILILKNPLFKAGLSVAQRLSYLANCMFWLFPLPRMVFVFAPMLYIFFNLKIYIATQQEFIAYTLTYMAASLLMQSYLFGRFRWPWVSDVYEYIQSVLLFRAVVSVFVAPRNPQFEVTAKGQTLDDDHVSSIALPYFAIFLLITVSLAVLGWRFITESHAHELLAVVGAWTMLNLLLAGLGLGAVCELRERRSAPRIVSKVEATLRIGGTETPVMIEDMSLGGLRVRVPPHIRVDGDVLGVLRLRDPGSPGGFLEAPVMSMQKGTRDLGLPLDGTSNADDRPGLGLAFHDTSGDRFRIVAAVAFADVGLIHSQRQTDNDHMGLARGSAIIPLWWLRQTTRGIYYGLFRTRRPVPAPASESIFAPIPPETSAPELVCSTEQLAA